MEWAWSGLTGQGSGLTGQAKALACQAGLTGRLAYGSPVCHACVYMCVHVSCVWCMCVCVCSYVDIVLVCHLFHPLT